MLIQLTALPCGACAVQMWRPLREEEVCQCEVLGVADAGTGCYKGVELDEEAGGGSGGGDCAEVFGGAEAG